MAHIFISYNDDIKDLAENLRTRFSEYDIKAWLFSRDKILGRKSWDEITQKIKTSHIVLLMISDRTQKSRGQLNEFDIAVKNKKTIFPVTTGKIDFSALPKKLANLQKINGIYISAHSIRSQTLQIVRTYFPELAPSRRKITWKYPKPGDWLEICNIDIYIERYFKIGETVYFRRISPMGLFECYAPSVKGLFWFWPPNLKPADFIDENGKIEKEKVPKEYRI